MKVALRIRRCDGDTAEAYLWRMSPPFEGYEFVITSANVVRFSGPECYMFAADDDAEVLEWLEMWPSKRGTLNHLEVIGAAGYLPVEEIGAEVAS